MDKWARWPVNECCPGSMSSLKSKCKTFGPGHPIINRGELFVEVTSTTNVESALASQWVDQPGQCAQTAWHDQFIRRAHQAESSVIISPCLKEHFTVQRWIIHKQNTRDSYVKK
jgi:hypothetical protein